MGCCFSSFLIPNYNIVLIIKIKLTKNLNWIFYIPSVKILKSITIYCASKCSSGSVISSWKFGYLFMLTTRENDKKCVSPWDCLRKTSFAPWRFHHKWVSLERQKKKMAKTAKTWFPSSKCLVSLPPERIRTQSTFKITLASTFKITLVTIFHSVQYRN